MAAKVKEFFVVSLIFFFRLIAQATKFGQHAPNRELLDKAAPWLEREPGVPVKPRVWRLPGTFPELEEIPQLKEKEDIGLAISGGGVRSTAQALGVAKLLHAKGYWSKIRYMSGNSGGALFVAPLGYLEDTHSIDAFLGGPPLGPENCTLTALETPQDGSFARHLGATPGPEMEKMIALANASGAKPYSWNAPVAYNLLGPFDRKSAASVPAPPIGTHGYERAKAAVAKTKAKVYPMNKNVPFPIIVSAQLQTYGRNLTPHCLIDVPKGQACPVTEVFGAPSYPLEYTPLYSGSPMLVEKKNKPTIGGGVVENFGFGASAPSSLPDGRTEVHSKEEVSVTPEYFVPLAFGMSSSIDTSDVIAEKTPEQADAEGTPAISLWSPADIRSKANGLTVVTDGFLVDNCAILPLLARGTKRIIALVSLQFAPRDPLLLHPGVIWWPGYFGRIDHRTRVIRPNCSSTTDPAMCNDQQLSDGLHMQHNASVVFKSEEYDKLWIKLNDLAIAGKPLVVEQELDVLENKLSGVRGGYRVRMLWIFAGDAMAEWKAALPDETRKLLDTEQTNDPGNTCHKCSGDVGSHTNPADISKMFPFYQTILSTWKHRLVVLLGESSAYNLERAAGPEYGGNALENFFGAPSALDNFFDAPSAAEPSAFGGAFTSGFLMFIGLLTVVIAIKVFKTIRTRQSSHASLAPLLG